MTAPLIAIRDGGLLQAEDLEAALAELLDRSATTQTARFEGPCALDYEVCGDAVTFHRFRARASNGQRVVLDGSILPLPMSQDEQTSTDPLVLRVGIEMQSAPVRENSVVCIARPRLRLLAPHERAVGGELVLGEFGPLGFVSAPAPADRMDATTASREWLRRVMPQLESSLELLALISARLTATDSPVLSWHALLGGVFASIGLAVEVQPSDAPAEVVRRVQCWLRSLACLPVRARQSGDGEIVAIVGKLHWEELLPQEQRGFAPELAHLERQVGLALSHLGGFARLLGAGIQELPEFMYCAGRTFRRWSDVNISSHVERHGEIDWRLDSLAPNHSVALAALWDAPDGQIAFGDVRFCNLIGGRRTNEIYLGPTSADAPHVIGPEAASLHGGCLVTPAWISLREAALYAPVAEA